MPIMREVDQTSIQIARVPVNHRIRVAIHHRGSLCPILWMRAGRDGSIYIGMGMDAPIAGELGDAQRQGNAYRVEYGKGEQFDETNLPNSACVSFKASGEVHLAHKVLRGEPLEGLNTPRSLCGFAFCHPARNPLPTKKNPKDFDVVIVGYNVDDACPMWGEVQVHPWDGSPSVPHINPSPKMTTSWQAAFGFQGFERTPNLAVYLLIGHGEYGQWPEKAYLLTVGLDDLGKPRKAKVRRQARAYQRT